MKINICNKIYEINCVESEEEKIKSLSRSLDFKARQLGQTLGLENEMLILLCALKLESEIEELKAKLKDDKILNEINHDMSNFSQKIKKLIDKIEDN